MPGRVRLLSRDSQGDVAEFLVACLTGGFQPVEGVGGEDAVAFDEGADVLADERYEHDDPIWRSRGRDETQQRHRRHPHRGQPRPTATTPRARTCSVSGCAVMPR